MPFGICLEGMLIKRRTLSGSVCVQSALRHHKLFGVLSSQTLAASDASWRISSGPDARRVPVFAGNSSNRRNEPQAFALKATVCVRIDTIGLRRGQVIRAVQFSRERGTPDQPMPHKMLALPQSQGCWPQPESYPDQSLGLTLIDQQSPAIASSSASHNQEPSSKRRA
jgi:hypothetical protein